MWQRGAVGAEEGQMRARGVRDAFRSVAHKKDRAALGEGSGQV